MLVGIGVMLLSGREGDGQVPRFPNEASYTLRAYREGFRVAVSRCKALAFCRLTDTHRHPVLLRACISDPDIAHLRWRILLLSNSRERSHSRMDGSVAMRHWWSSVAIDGERAALDG